LINKETSGTMRGFVPAQCTVFLDRRFVTESGDFT